MGINKEFLLPNAKQIRHFSFGGKLLDCRESLKEAINNRSDDYLPIQWYTSDPYNAGQAITLLELSNYSFHMYHQGEGTGYSFTILTSLREEMHYIDIDTIETKTFRIQFEQGKYDALLELLEANKERN